LENGFISNIPDEAPGAHENQPVEITGKPVSEIILENREQKNSFSLYTFFFLSHNEGFH